MSFSFPNKRVRSELASKVRPAHLGCGGRMDSPYYPIIEAAAKKSPMNLQPGRGDEGDTIGDRSVLVYDSNAFPFYAGERYHQFHNDFKGPRYPAAYNALKDKMVENGQLKETGCPEGFAA